MSLRLTRRTFASGLGSLAALAALAPTSATSVLGQTAYPSRPVRIVVPFLPGGGADLIARLIPPHLQQLLGQSFFVENRAGAAGRIGTGAGGQSRSRRPDALDDHRILDRDRAAYRRGLGYDPRKDFAPVSLLTRNAVVLVVHPSVPANTLADYIALARGKPGQLFYASSGVGGPNHLAGEIFNRMAGIDIVHVPFPGTGAAIPAVIGNQVGAMWGFIAGLIPHIRGGSLKCARGRRQGALAGAAGCADRRRSRRAGLRGDLLDRVAGARQRRPGGHRQALAGGERGDARSGGPRRSAARRFGHRREQAARNSAR